MVPQIQLLADGLRSRAGGQKSNRSPKRSREIGVALMQSGQRGSGGGSALEMMGNLAQVWGGSRMMDRADRAEQDRMKAIGTALQNRDSAALYGMGDPNAMQLGLQLDRMAAEQAARQKKDSAPNLQKYYDDQGREVAGYWDPSVGDFVQVGGAKMGAKAQEAATADVSHELQTDQLVSQIDAVAAHPGLDGSVGKIQGRLPTWMLGVFDDNVTDFRARLQQLEGGAFMQARQMLSGGGQITDFEGAKAADAQVRMQQAQSEDDFYAALADWRDAVTTGYNKIQESRGLPGKDFGQMPARASAGGAARGATARRAEKRQNGTTQHNVPWKVVD